MMGGEGHVNSSKECRANYLMATIAGHSASKQHEEPDAA